MNSPDASNPRFLHRIYLWGYGGGQMPRWLRQLIAGSETHRAWVLGRDGFFGNSEMCLTILR